MQRLDPNFDNNLSEKIGDNNLSGKKKQWNMNFKKTREKHSPEPSANLVSGSSAHAFVTERQLCAH